MVVVVVRVLQKVLVSLLLSAWACWRLRPRLHEPFVGMLLVVLFEVAPGTVVSSTRLLAGSEHAIKGCCVYDTMDLTLSVVASLEIWLPGSL